MSTESSDGLSPSELATPLTVIEGENLDGAIKSELEKLKLSQKVDSEKISEKLSQKVDSEKLSDSIKKEIERREIKSEKVLKLIGDNKRITRSRSLEDKNIVLGTPLSFERKRNPIKKIKVMENLKLDEAIKLIPHCTGNDDTYQFINACDIAVGAIEEKHLPLLIKYITTRLSGRALEMIKYKKTDKWNDIKRYLTDAFDAHHSASTLQMQLNSIKMKIGEDVNSYANRVEKLFYTLSNKYTSGKTESEAKIIHETLREQTVAIFIKGLINPIKTIVKSQVPKTLEIAKQLAQSEEVEINSERELRDSVFENSNDYNRFNSNIQRTNNNFGAQNNNLQHVNNGPRYGSSYRNNNIQPRYNGRYQPPFHSNMNPPNLLRPPISYNNNRPRIKCYNCNGDHVAAQCNLPSTRRDFNNGNIGRSNNRSNFTRPPTNYNRGVNANTGTGSGACAYCSRMGHDISTCYKKRNDEERVRALSGNVNPSGQEQGPAQVRTISEISNQIADIDVSTSYLL